MMNPEGIQPQRARRSPVAEPSTDLQTVGREGDTPVSPVALLTEDGLLALLQRRHLPLETIEEFVQSETALKSRKVCVALAAHPRAPYHLALRLIRQFYTFDLMRFSLHAAVAADLRRAAEEQLIARLTSVTLGERLALARRGSQAVAAALLLDRESPVSRTALENSRLTEAAVIKAVLRPNSPAAFVELVCRHPKWSLRREIRMAVLRSPHTPLAPALEFARTLPPPLLRDILHSSRLPEKIKAYLRTSLNGTK